MALPTSDGTNQITNSRLGTSGVSFRDYGAKGMEDVNLPQRKERVDVQCAAFTYPFVDWKEDDSAKGQTSEESGGYIAGRWTTMTLLNDVRDDPASNGDLHANVDQDEEREEVHSLLRHNLFELALLFAFGDRLYMFASFE